MHALGDEALVGSIDNRGIGHSCRIDVDIHLGGWNNRHIVVLPQLVLIELIHHGCKRCFLTIGLIIHVCVVEQVGHILCWSERDGQRIGLVGLRLHLVDVPIGLQIRKVADTNVGTITFDLLVVPQREGVVITIGEDDCVRLEGGEVVLAEVTCSESI